MPEPDEMRDLESTLLRLGWPNRGSRVEDQNISPLVDRAAVKAFAPDEDGVYLLPPPFVTIAQDAEGNPSFWRGFGALDEVDPAEAVVIADFSAGSDTVMIVDFGTRPARILRLVHGELGNHWVLVTGNVEELGRILVPPPPG